MKRFVVLSLMVLFLSCTEKNKTLSPAETSKIVIESFHYGDKENLRKYTTQSGYENLAFIQDLFLVDKDSAINFQVLDEKEVDGATWIKFKTDLEETPDAFKLVKEEGMWKVTQEGLEERDPF